ncbi:UbiD family decarboxylase [Aurantibacillus circumpalustris]|uniref:UbiD family decarboxylase n=1 Tax=Aurantibacillus circumpalustris TaxID=3036359 RepID=UPI00295BAF76|nr:UbiD family decarboxylase [Aurantibacillus circumpalustris]
MTYTNLQSCLIDLEKNGHLIRIKEEVDPDLEMAAIHLRVFSKGGPAILFEKVKGSNYKAVSNLFGTLERSKFMFRDTLSVMQELVQLRNSPMDALKKPLRYISTGLAAYKALPKKSSFSSGNFKEIKITNLPLIKHWPMDGGAFVTLPQVYTEDIDKPGVMASNLGMYRVQLNGNDYETNKEIGLHYQIHRGIGVHQNKTNKKNIPLKVSVFVGGPPAHTLAAVMPLPEGISELTFAGALGGKRFRYTYKDGFCISLDADFVITGEVHPNENKPEGPFGDHLGYYSLKHPFPVMRVHKVYAKENAIWPFTVVGRPPQEDTAFGALIHEISGSAIPNEIPGVKEIHAVDAAGVHPLLLAVGSERYTPYLKNKRPAELLTQANRILGTGQLSLAKYLFISADETKEINCHDIRGFLKHVFERIDLNRDLHFHTKTTIDTLDYSGDEINEGSKLVLAAYGDKIRDLSMALPNVLAECDFISHPFFLMEGVIAVTLNSYTNSKNAKEEIKILSLWIEERIDHFKGIVQIVIYNDFEFTSSTKNLNDYLWVTYTRSNPSNDIYGVFEFIENKHWGCRGPMIIDARKKPHHAPELKVAKETEEKIARFFEKGGVLEKWA